MGDIFIGSHFLPTRLNANGFFAFLNNEFYDLLKNIPLNIRGNSWFQLDDCTTHYGKDPRQWLNFSQKMDRAGSVAFADLISLDFFIWGILKHTKSICLINDLQSKNLNKELCEHAKKLQTHVSQPLVFSSIDVMLVSELEIIILNKTFNN